MRIIRILLLPTLCAATLSASKAFDLLERAQTVQSYAACVTAVTTNSTPAGWCQLVAGFAQHWDLCEDAFGFLDGYGACSLSLTECATLTSDAQLLPVAAECLDSCSDGTGCTVPTIGRLLKESGACAEAPPAALLMTLMDLPFGPLLSFGLAYFNLCVTPGFKFSPKAALADRYPLPEYIGTWLQSLILLRAVYFTLKHVDPVHQGSTCGFLLFNTMALFGAVAATLAPIGAMLTATRRGIDAVRDEKGNTARLVATLALVLPSCACYGTVLLMVVGTVPLFMTAIPALVALLPITLVQAILFGIVYAIVASAGQNGDGNAADAAAAAEKEEKHNMAIIAAASMEAYCQPNIGGDALDKAAASGSGKEGAAGQDLFVIITMCQIMQALGIIAWSWYLGMNYVDIIEEYFTAFTLLPFNWDFNFSFYFSASLWSRLLTFDLGEFELFGSSLVVQLVTLGLSLLRRAAARCCSSSEAEPVVQKQSALEMVQNALGGGYQLDASGARAGVV
jgi:hypothetical protein